MNRSLDARLALLAPRLKVVLPPGAGPFPVVVQMHDCRGVNPLQQDYAEVARALGVAAVIVDSSDRAA